MLNALLLAASLLHTGMITGAIVAPPQQEISQPVRVILLPPAYTDIWTNEVQKRLDFYWQQFQPAFRARKEFFSDFARQAHKNATNYVLARMRRDPSAGVAEYFLEVSPGDHFEFRNVPFGEYKVLALGRIGNRDVIWQEFVDVQSEIPHFVELKKRLP